jgi:hypothetical protein
MGNQSQQVECLIISLPQHILHFVEWVDIHVYPLPEKKSFRFTGLHYSMCMYHVYSQKHILQKEHSQRLKSNKTHTHTHIRKPGEYSIKHNTSETTLVMGPRGSGPAIRKHNAQRGRNNNKGVIKFGKYLRLLTPTPSFLTVLVKQSTIPLYSFDV